MDHKDLRGYVRKTMRQILRNIRRCLADLIFFIRRKSKKFSYNFQPIQPEQPSYTFSIICVKRTAYVPLAINNINSLHFHSPSHTVRLYCDALCFAEAQKMKRKLDYPQQVDIIRFWERVDYPWQYCELDVLRANKSLEDVYFVDADTVWLRSPQISSDKITFYVKDRLFRDSHNETVLMKQFFDRENYLNYGHYNTSLLALPKKFHSDKFIDTWLDFTQKILEIKYLPAVNEQNLTHLNRLAEQIGASLAVQINFNGEDIVTLQARGQPSNLDYYYLGLKNHTDFNQILSSSYFGVNNEVYS